MVNKELEALAKVAAKSTKAVKYLNNFSAMFKKARLEVVC
jgi:hypothetical protein